MDPGCESSRHSKKRKEKKKKDKSSSSVYKSFRAGSTLWGPNKLCSSSCDDILAAVSVCISKCQGGDEKIVIVLHSVLSDGRRRALSARSVRLCR